LLLEPLILELVRPLWAQGFNDDTECLTFFKRQDL